MACAHVIGPISSVCHWKGNVEEGEEWHCLFKTRKSLFSNVAVAIQKLHSYECPQIIAVPIVAGNEDYLAWMDGELVNAD